MSAEHRMLTPSAFCLSRFPQLNILHVRLRLQLPASWCLLGKIKKHHFCQLSFLHLKKKKVEAKDSLLSIVFSNFSFLPQMVRSPMSDQTSSTPRAASRRRSPSGDSIIPLIQPSFPSGRRLRSIRMFSPTIPSPTSSFPLAEDTEDTTAGRRSVCRPRITS